MPPERRERIVKDIRIKKNPKAQTANGKLGSSYFER